MSIEERNIPPDAIAPPTKVVIWMPNLSVSIPATGDRKNVVPIVSEPTKAEIISQFQQLCAMDKIWGDGEILEMISGPLIATELEAAKLLSVFIRQRHYPIKNNKTMPKAANACMSIIDKQTITSINDRGD